MKISREIYLWMGSCLNYGSHPLLDLDIGILEGFFNIVRWAFFHPEPGSRPDLPWWRSVLSWVFVFIMMTLQKHNFHIVAAPCGAGAPSFPLVPSLPRILLFFTFAFFSVALTIFFFVHPFPFYQNSPTPFPGRRL